MPSRRPNRLQQSLKPAPAPLRSHLVHIGAGVQLRLGVRQIINATVLLLAFLRRAQVDRCVLLKLDLPQFHVGCSGDAGDPPLVRLAPRGLLEALDQIGRPRRRSA